MELESEQKPVVRMQTVAADTAVGPLAFDHLPRVTPKLENSVEDSVADPAFDPLALDDLWMTPKIELKQEELILEDDFLDDEEEEEKEVDEEGGDEDDFSSHHPTAVNANFKGEMSCRTVGKIEPHEELPVSSGKDLGTTAESFKSADNSNMKNVTFSCVDCNVSFTSPIYLVKHSKLCRSRSYLMEYRFKERYSMTIRKSQDVTDGPKLDESEKAGAKKRIYTGEKRFSCTECSHKSFYPSDLKRHMSTHTGEKPFSCAECGYNTSQLSTLERHMSTHTGEKPFSCAECGYNTSRLSNLKDHMRTHTGEKPFSCTECGYKSSRSSDLKKHMRTHMV